MQHSGYQTKGGYIHLKKINKNHRLNSAQGWSKQSASLWLQINLSSVTRCVTCPRSLAASALFLTSQESVAPSALQRIQLVSLSRGRLCGSVLALLVSPRAWRKHCGQLRASSAPPAAPRGRFHPAPSC